VKRTAATLVLALALAASAARAGTTGGLDDAIAALFRAVRAGDEVATTQAASALVARGPAGASELAKSLADRTPAELVWALRCLREIGSDAVKETAFTLCSHENALVRADAVTTAYVLGKASAVPVLQRAAADADDTVRRRAFDGILEYGSQAPGTLAVAVNGVVDKDFWVVLQAFQILDCQKKPEGGPDRVLVELSKLVGKLDERNSEAYFDFLVRRGGNDGGPVIVSALEAARPCVVVSALKAAGRLRLAEATQRATRLAGSSDSATSVAAIDCLSHVNDPETVPILVDLLERVKDPERIEALCVALRRMTSRLYGADVALWRKYLAGQAK
jgi:HEAT repeat protein